MRTTRLHSAWLRAVRASRARSRPRRRLRLAAASVSMLIGASLVGPLVLPDSQAAPVVVSFQQGVDGYSGTRDTYVEDLSPSTSFGTSIDVKVDLNDGALGGSPVFESQATAENNGSTIVVSKPSGTVDGDLLIATVGGEGGGATLSPPAGWTEIFHIPSPGSYVVAAWWRIASGEPSSFTFTSDWPHAMNAGVVRYSNVDQADPIDVFATATGIGSPVAPDVTTTVADAVVLRLGALENHTVAQIDYPAGHTGRAEVDSNSSPGQVTSLADVVQVSAGSTGTATFPSPSDDYVAATIAIAPANAGGTDPTDQALLAFDGIFGPGPGQIPYGATITSATLDLTVNNESVDSVLLHRMVGTWSESDTWDSLGSGLQRDGVEAATAIDVTFAGTGTLGAITISGLEATVQAWSDGAPNEGWAFFATGTNGWDFDSSEHGTLANRPELNVTYEVNSPPVVTNPGSQSDAEGDVISLAVVGSDPDGDALTWTATGLPDGLSIAPGSGVISGSTPYTAAGSYSVTVRATDDGAPSQFDEATFAWTIVDSLPPTGAIVAADTGGGGGGDDLLTTLDVSDPDPATNETPIGSGLGTTSVRGLSVQPGTGVLFGATTTHLGTIDTGSGVFSPIGPPFGSGSGTMGAVTFDNVEGITFDPGTGALLAVHRDTNGNDAIFRVDPATGSVVTGHFGGDDYVEIDPSQATYDDVFDIAFDPDDGVLYGILWDGNAHYKLAPIDLVTGSATTSGATMDAAAPHGLAFDAAGDGWVVGSPGAGGVYAAVDTITREIGTTYPIDDADGYEAISFPPANQPPAFDQDLGDRSDSEGDAVSFSASATDPEGATLVYTAAGLPPGVAIDSGSGLVSGSLSYASSGTYPVELKATDPLGATGVDTFTWTVSNTNRAPTVTNPGDRANDEGDVVTFAIAGSDPDGDNLAWTATGLPDGLAVDSGTGVISGTLTYLSDGVHPVVVRATDDGSPNLFDEVSFTWTVSDVNRAPVVTNPGAQSSTEGGGVHLPLVGGDPDGDNLTWTATGLAPGLSIDPGSGLISGTVSGGAAGGSPYAATVRATDDGSPTLFDEAAFSWSVSVVDPGIDGGLLLTTQNDESSSDNPDLGSWSRSDVLSLSNPGLSFEPPTTAGTLASMVDFEAFGSIDLNGIHYVSSSVSVAGSVDLQPGDILFTTKGGADLTSTNTLQVYKEDVARFRPDVPGDYTSGTFAIVLENPVGAETRGVSLVEEDTLVGDVTLQAGWFLFTRGGGAEDSDVRLFIPTGAGPGATAGTEVVLADEVVGSQIWGVDLVETSQGGSDVPAGAVLVALNSNESGIGTNGLSVTENDVFYFEFTSTSYGSGSVVASATLFFEGADVQFDSGAESIDGLSYQPENRPPVLSNPGDQSSAEGDAVSLSIAGSDPDGDTITWTATGLPDGLSIDSVTGVISGTLAYDAAGAHTVTVRATDDGVPSRHGEITFAWDVADTNRSPVVSTPPDQSDAENDSVSLAVVGSDPDGDSLTWSATGLPGGLSIDPGSGVISGTLTYASAGSHPVTVRATDDGSPNLFDEVTFTWDVANTNRSPVVSTPADQSDAENDSVSLAVSGSDPDGHDLTWSATGLPGGLSIDPGSGVISGTLSYDSAGTHSVTVRATDDGTPNLFDEVTFTWDVANTNRSPIVGNPGDQAGDEGDTVSFAVTVWEPDGDGVTWSATGLPLGLSIDPSTGVISGTISFDAAGAHSVVVRATDDGTPTESGEAAFAWSVSNTNRPPVVGYPGSQSDAESDAVSLAISGTDPDGDDLTWSASGLPPGLSIDPGSGVISGTLSYSAAGSHGVTVRATDNGSPSLFDETTFLWEVSNTNRAPTVTDPGDQNDAEGDAISLSIVGSDPDGDMVTWSATGLPDGLSIDAGSGVISGTLTYDAAGTHAVTVRATDDGSPVEHSEVAFTWDVADTNRAPIVTDPGDQNAAEADSVTLAVVGSDPDGDGLTWTATGLPGGLAIDAGSGVISGTIGFEESGYHSVTVRSTDDGTPTEFTEVAFTWAVANTNRAPTVLNPGDQTSNEGSAVSLAINASDPDGNSIGFSATGLPTGLTINSGTGVISGMLGFELSPSYSVVVTVVDNGTPPASSQVSFTWTIGDVNRAPVLGTLVDRQVEQFNPVTVSPSATDPDGDALTWSAAGLPNGVTIAPTTGVMDGAPSAAGAFTVTVTVRDNGAPSLSDADSYRLTVTSPPGYPEIDAIDNQSSFLDGPGLVEPAGSHPDGLGLTWSATGLPPGIGIDTNTGAMSGTATVVGSFDVVVTLTDSRDQAVEASFTWSIVDPDLPPVVTDDVISVQVDKVRSGVAVDVVGNDSDPEGGALSLVSVGAPEAGTAVIVDGMVVFTPPLGWLGTVTMPYVVSDAGGNESSAVLTITVEESLSDQLAAAALVWDAQAQPAIDLTELTLDPGDGTELVLGSVIQSLYVLRLPLALLGGAVFWSLLLGGILNLGFVLRGGIPRVVRRTSRNVAVVMVPHGMKLEALSEPGGGKPVWRFLATDRGLEATGRRAEVGDSEWAEVVTTNGHAWVPALNLTEEVDRLGFADDPAPLNVLREFVGRARSRRDISHLVSAHGLAIAHHGPVEHFGPDRISSIMDDLESHTWKGRNPAYQDMRGTFDTAVATSLLDAWDHPRRQLMHDAPTVPSTVVPVEFTNFHFISVGADVHGPERLDLPAWSVAFSYEAGRPRIITLIKEG